MSWSYRDRETLERALKVAERTLDRVHELEVRVAELREELDGKKKKGADDPLVEPPAPHDKQKIIAGPGRRSTCSPGWCWPRLG